MLFFYHNLGFIFIARAISCIGYDNIVLDKVTAEVCERRCLAKNQKRKCSDDVLQSSQVSSKVNLFGKENQGELKKL